MNRPQIAEIEDAIIGAICGAASLSYIPNEQVQSLSQRTIDFANEQIIVAPPAVLVTYMGGQYEAREISNKRYAVDESFLLIAVAANLRGPEEAKQGDAGGEKGVYEILDDLKALFGGLKIEANATSSIYCRLLGTTIEGVTEEGHLAYGLEIAARGAWDNA